MRVEKVKNLKCKECNCAYCPLNTEFYLHKCLNGIKMDEPMTKVLDLVQPRDYNKALDMLDREVKVKER